MGGLGAFLLAAEVWGAGALAIDGRQGHQWGWAVNHPHQAQADAHALRQCGQGCGIVRRFADTCAAYAGDQARGSTAYGFADAPTSAQAQTNALNFCRHYGGANSHCVIRVWGCDSVDPVKTSEPDPELDEAGLPEAPAVAETRTRGKGIEQAGEATAHSPEWACKQARDATKGYALPTEYSVINDSGWACLREVKPDWDTSAPGWTCKVRILYDRRGVDSDRELRVATGIGPSREYACQSVAHRNLSMELALKQGSKSNWEGGRRDSGCYCPVQGYQSAAGRSREWYCERIVRYHR